jgi:hypothetical protein
MGQLVSSSESTTSKIELTTDFGFWQGLKQTEHISKLIVLNNAQAA